MDNLDGGKTQPKASIAGPGALESATNRKKGYPARC